VKLKVKHFDCEFECDAPDSVVTQYFSEFEALVKSYYRARAVANNRIGAVVENVARVKNAVESWEYSLERCYDQRHEATGK
jgi:hypothetical protein